MARLVAIIREGLGWRIPAAGGELLLQLGQPGEVTRHRLAALRGEPEPCARPGQRPGEPTVTRRRNPSVLPAAWSRATPKACPVCADEQQYVPARRSRAGNDTRAAITTCW